MVNVTIKISEPHWQTLKKMAKRLSLEPEDLMQQEMNESLASMEVWLERASIRT
jgi:hypothetical protein